MRRVGTAAAGIVAALIVFAAAPPVRVASADAVPVRFRESVTHGFVALRAGDGATLAHGELVQTPQGDRIESRLLFRFTDGSLYDETVTFTQQRVFRLERYRLVQRGKSFPAASEISFDRASRHYRAVVGDKPEDRAEGRLDMPEDLYNGMAITLLKNVAPGGHVTGHLVAFTPKPQLLKLALEPEGTDRYLLGRSAGIATRYRMRLEIGGLTGVLAAVVGKSPPELRYWITTGPAPGFVRFEGPMYFQGPRWRIELSAPRWPEPR